MRFGNRYTRIARRGIRHRLYRYNPPQNEMGQGARLIFGGLAALLLGGMIIVAIPFLIFVGVLCYAVPPVGIGVGLAFLIVIFCFINRWKVKRSWRAARRVYDPPCNYVQPDKPKVLRKDVIRVLRGLGIALTIGIVIFVISMYVLRTTVVPTPVTADEMNVPVVRNGPSLEEFVKEAHAKQLNTHVPVDLTRPKSDAPKYPHL